MAFGVDALGLGGGPEQFGDVGETLGLGLLGKGAVFLVGLAFAGKRFLEIVFGRGHALSSMVDGSDGYGPFCPAPALSLNEAAVL